MVELKTTIEKQSESIQILKKNEVTLIQNLEIQKTNFFSENREKIEIIQSENKSLKQQIAQLEDELDLKINKFDEEKHLFI